MSKPRSLSVVGILGAVIVVAAFPAQALARGPATGRFVTGAYAVRETDAIEAITDAMSGLLSPLVPQVLTQTLPSVSLPAIGTQTISATTVDTATDSTSDASAATVTILIGTPNSDTITIASATSETKADCDAGPELHLATTLGAVSVNGTAITITGDPNQVVPLPNSGGQMVLNQQILNQGQVSGYGAANAVNVSVADRDRIIAHTEGFASCD